MRNGAIYTIGAFKRPESVPLLVNMLETDAKESTREVSAQVLENLADPRAQPALLKAAKSDSVWLAFTAMKALAPSEVQGRSGAGR